VRGCDVSLNDPGLSVQVAHLDPDECVLTASGELSVRTAGLVGRRLTKALRTQNASWSTCQSCE